MLGSLSAVHVELTLEELVYGIVESERRAARPLHTKPRIKVETSRTFYEEVYLASADLEGLFARRVILPAPFLVWKRHVRVLYQNPPHMRGVFLLVLVDNLSFRRVFK